MLRKKQVVLASLVAMIGLAGYFNWAYQNADNGSVSDSQEMALGEARLVSSGAISEQKDYFASSRMERETGRSKALESLRAVAESPDTNPTAKQEAEMRMVEMALRIEKEAAAEAEIKAKGFSDCVVYINEGAVTVVVKSEQELTGTDAARIQEIILRLSDVEADKISITRYQ